LTTGPAWSDEFSSWSSAKWTAKKWTFNSTYRVDPSQVSVSGGVLNLTSKYEGGGSYVSGTVFSNRTFDHGYFEARIKWPKGTGFDSSFWMVREGTISPRPEIDIIEAYPYDPYVYPGPNRFQATMHYMSGGVLRHHQFTYDAGRDLTNEWHTVGVEWIPGKRMTFYFDGVSIGSVTVDVIPAQPMNAIFSQIISSWPAPPDSTTPTLATMQVDWVRWWDAKP
jgi:beta-glucanase (GH16 family)